MLELLIDRLGVVLESLEISVAHRFLQLVHRIGIEQVVLAIATPLIPATDIERGVLRLPVGEGGSVTNFDIARDLLHADAFHAGRCPSEVAIHDGLVNTDCLEDLSAAVGLDG